MKKLLAFILLLSLAVSLCACGEVSEESVSVTAVSMITGTSVMNSSFGGMVVAGRTEDLELDKTLSLDKVLVSVGETVNTGDVLYTYNDDALQLSIEQAELEIEQLNTTLESNAQQSEELVKARDEADSDDILQYTLEIQSLDASTRETEYNLALKTKELERQKSMSADTNVYSPLDGVVTSINEDGYDDYGNPLAFMTLTETGTLRVKGIINEVNRGSLFEGQALDIVSRTDPTLKWSGILDYIDWDTPEQNQNQYYNSDEMQTSSKYPFYVAIDNTDGLFMGQHVYIRIVGAETSGFMLPAIYISDTTGKAFVWAADKNDRLEKRSVTLGSYDEMSDCYEITEGLSAKDYIAFPDDSLTVGISVIRYDENSFGGVSETYAEGDIYSAGAVEDGIIYDEQEVVFGEE